MPFISIIIQTLHRMAPPICRGRALGPACSPVVVLEEVEELGKSLADE